MDLRSLITFVQVAESGSFTRAAEKLGYSQPTVSFHIKQLEEELGLPLFDRIGHTVSLTDGGREALTRAQQICQLSREMVHASTQPSQPGGTVRLAMADSLCAPLITQRLASFRRLYPQISLHITTGGTDELFRLLDHNEADVVCTLDHHIYNTTYRIFHEEPVDAHFICAPTHPLASRAPLCLQELLSQPFLLTEKGMSYRRLLDEFLASASLELHPVLEIGRADLIVHLVEENVGVSFLPDYVTESSVRAGRLVRLAVAEFHAELWKQLLCHRDKWISPQMQVTLEYLSRISLGADT